MQKKSVCVCVCTHREIDAEQVFRGLAYIHIELEEILIAQTRRPYRNYYTATPAQY